MNPRIFMSISDALHTTTNTYDALNRLSQTTLPDSSTITYGYAPNGTLLSWNSAAVRRLDANVGA